MSLWIHVAFGPVPNTARLRVPHQLPHAPIMAAHVHIGRAHPSTTHLPSAPGVLLDKGVTACPCELDIAFSEIAVHLQDEGPGAHIFIDPTGVGTNLQLDIALLRTRDGCRCAAEVLLRGCRPGAVRTAELPELSGDAARVIIRCSSPAVAGAKVRISANEPRRRSIANAPLLVGA